MNAPPLVFDVKGNSLEDGPGIRSVIFFKGCPLDCSWCQNPEGKRVAADLWWEPERCVKDGGCMEVCPRGAISPDNPFFVDRERFEAMAERVLFIDEGKLVYDGTIAELTSGGKHLDERFRELTGSGAGTTAG